VADERDIHVEDPTPIIPDWDYLAEQCVQLEASLRRAASDVGACGRVVKSGRGGVQALEDLRQSLVDRREQCAGAVRAIDRYLDLKQDSNEGVRLTEDQPTPKTLRALPPAPQPLALLPPPSPTLTDRVRALAMHPALHVALPVGALAYLRLTTGKWPTLEEWIAGGTLLVARFGAMVGTIRKAVGLGGSTADDEVEPPAPPAPPAPPVTTPR
jgi:hypothetical protein